MAGSPEGGVLSWAVFLFFFQTITRDDTPPRKTPRGLRGPTQRAQAVHCIRAAQRALLGLFAQSRFLSWGPRNRQEAVSALEENTVHQGDIHSHSAGW